MTALQLFHEYAGLHSQCLVERTYGIKRSGGGLDVAFPALLEGLECNETALQTRVRRPNILECPKDRPILAVEIEPPALEAAQLNA